MRRLLWENGLSLVLLTMFLGTWAGQIATGLSVHNQDQEEHGQPTIGLGAYLTSGAFIEATAENWESEFLQMAVFILLTIWLRQKGSAESKKMEGEEDVDEDPREHQNDPDAPWSVRKGGLILWVYSNSLSVAFLLLFGFSFFIHAWGGRGRFLRSRSPMGKSP